MSKEDAHLCIQHHATSKITSVSDLTMICTFGFRGEALSSISAVSKMTLSTKEADNEGGICLTIQDGAVVDESAKALPTGTDIALAELFIMYLPDKSS